MDNCIDLLTVPVAATGTDYRAQSQVENYIIPNHGGSLNHQQLALAERITHRSLVLCIPRQSGMTTMLAAVARQQSSLGRRVLVLTNNHTSVLHMESLIDDVSVNLWSFSNIEQLTHAGEFYHHIIIDMAECISHSDGQQTKQYIKDCCDRYIQHQKSKYAAGSIPKSTIVTMAGTPKTHSLDGFSKNSLKIY